MGKRCVLKRPSGADASARPDCERSTVVVPRSHIDGTYAKMMKQKSLRNQNTVAKKAGEAHFVKLGPDAVVEKRARFLELRPPSIEPLPYHSVFLLWNSRLLHQGHTNIRSDQDRTSKASDKKPFDPAGLQPKLFDLQDPSWIKHLQEEGYVGIRNILDNADVEKALSHLLENIRQFSPSAKKVSHLGQVTQAHFPPTMNGTFLGLGMPHSSFAWYIRSHAKIHEAFGMLFPGQVLTGSVDLVFLSPPGSSKGNQRATCSTHEQWLHADQNEHQTCGKLQMYQGMLSLFSKETLSWGRISVPVCMAPKCHCDVAGLNAEKSLLAMCLAGVASTHWPQLGVRHRQGRVTFGMKMQGVTKKFRQLPVSLSPDISPQLAKHLRKMTAAQLYKNYSVEELSSFVRTEARRYISEGISPNTNIPRSPRKILVVDSGNRCILRAS